MLDAAAAVPEVEVLEEEEEGEEDAEVAVVSRLCGNLFENLMLTIMFRR